MTADRSADRLPSPREIRGLVRTLALSASFESELSQNDEAYAASALAILKVFANLRTFTALTPNSKGGRIDLTGQRDVYVAGWQITFYADDFASPETCAYLAILMVSRIDGPPPAPPGGRQPTPGLPTRTRATTYQTIDLGLDPEYALAAEIDLATASRTIARALTRGPWPDRDLAKTVGELLSDLSRDVFVRLSDAAPEHRPAGPVPGAPSGVAQVWPPLTLACAAATEADPAAATSTVTIALVDPDGVTGSAMLRFIASRYDLRLEVRLLAGTIDKALVFALSHIAGISAGQLSQLLGRYCSVPEPSRLAIFPPRRAAFVRVRPIQRN